MKAGGDSRGDEETRGLGEFPIQIQERLWVNSKMSLTSVGCTLSSIIFPPSRLRRSVTIFCWIATLPISNSKRSQENTCPNRRRQSGMRQSMPLRPKNKFACLPSVVSQKFRSAQRDDALEASDATGVSCAVDRKLIQDTRLRPPRSVFKRVICGHRSFRRGRLFASAFESNRTCSSQQAFSVMGNQLARRAFLKVRIAKLGLKGGRHPASRRCGHDSSLRNKVNPQKKPTSYPDVRRP